MKARKVVNIGLTFFVLVAIVALYRWTPTQQDIQQPVAVNGEVGKPVHTPRFDLTVTGVRTSKKLRVPRTDAGPGHPVGLRRDRCHGQRDQGADPHQ